MKTTVSGIASSTCAHGISSCPAKIAKSTRLTKCPSSLGASVSRTSTICVTKE